MIWIFKIETIFGMYAEDNWHVTIAIESSSTLEELHSAIQEAVEFDNDHMYEFYISRTERSQRRVVFDDENKKLYYTSLENIYPLGKAQKLYYLFDYGDSWLFKVTKSRKKEQKAKEGVEYPYVIDEVGGKPEQYPDWEE